MKVRLWGVRGSIACPGPTTVRYGGNTTCYEVRADNGELIILDAGTGLRELASSLVPEMPIQGTFLFTHTHHDHLIGYPFFIPLYVPGNGFDLYGPIHFEKSFEGVMRQHLDYAFFPVRMEEFAARLDFHDLREETLTRGAFTITSHYANHPVTTLAYRIEVDGQCFVFTGDTEPHLNYLADDPSADPEDVAEVQNMVDEQNSRWLTFIQGADLCIYDAQYTPEEYPNFKGWGHSPMNIAIDNCIKAKVKTLLMTHHNPSRTDDDLDELLQRWTQYVCEKGSDLNIDFAMEKRCYELKDQ